MQGNTARSFTFHHTIYCGQELRTLMQHAGFADVRLFGNLDGVAYDLNATPLMAVAMRQC